MAHLTPFSFSAPAGALHTPLQPVINMSLNPTPSLFGHSDFCPLRCKQKFLCSFACLLLLKSLSSFGPSLFLTWESGVSGCLSGGLEKETVPLDKKLMEAVRRYSYCGTRLLWVVGIYEHWSVLQVCVDS